MASTIVEELPPGAFVEDENGLRGSRAWNMLADSEADCYVGLASVGVFRGAAYRNRKNEIVNPFLICRTRIVTQVTPGPATSDVLYRATADYSTKEINATIREPEPGGPAIWKVESSLESRVVAYDINGDPIVNSSFQEFEPKSSPTFTNEVLVGQKVLQFPNDSAALNHFRRFLNTLNISTFKGAKRGELKCVHASPEEIESGQYMCTVRLEYRQAPDVGNVQIIGGNTAEGWDEIRADMGTRIYDENASNKDDRWAPITAKGVPIDTPVHLDGAGGLLDAGAKPFVHVFKHFKHTNHAAILGP